MNTICKDYDRFDATALYFVNIKFRIDIDFIFATYLSTHLCNMATTGGSPSQWEVVGKNKSGKQTTTGKLTKDQQRKFIESMPRIEDLPALKESQTLFEAFNEKQKKQEEHKKHENGKVQKSPKGSAAVKKKPSDKKKQVNPEVTFNSIDDAINALDKNEVQALLDNVVNKFPEAPSIWLKDLVSYFNNKLATSGEHSDPVYSNRPIGYPCSLLSKNIRTILTSTLKKCTDNTLQLFHEHCMSSLIQNILQGAPVTGYKLLLQCLAQEKPALITSCLNKFMDLIKLYMNRPAVCLSIMWTVGQCGSKNFNSGLKVWLDLMFPMIGMKAYSKFTIDYIIGLFKKHDTIKSIEVLGVREYFSLMDFMFISSPSIATNQHKQFRDLYPKLKEAVFGNHPETTLRQFFPCFLQRLQPKCSVSYKKELLNCLVMCLKTDKHTYSIWRQLYTKHLVQSSILLDHLLVNWEVAKKSLPRVMLKETLSTFKVTNSELAMNQDGVKECTRCTEELLSKMSVAGVPWRLFVFLFVIIFGCLLAYDVHLHGDFQKSRTGQLLKESGLLIVFNQACNRIGIYSNIAIEWTQKNVPIYFKKVRDVCEPYILLFWEKVFVVCMFLVDYTEDARNWLSKNVQSMLIWVNDQAPGILAKITEVTSVIWLYASKYLDVLWTFLVYYFNIVSTWIHQTILTKDFNFENIQKAVVGTFAAIQEMLVKSISWLVAQVQTVVG